MTAMRGYHTKNLRQKVAFLVLAICGSTLVLACLLMLAVGVFNRLDTLRQEMVVLTEMTGQQSTAAIEFNDNAAGFELLLALDGHPYVMVACLYQEHGYIFAKYARFEKQACPGTAGDERMEMLSGNLEVVRNIMVRGEKVGSIMVRSSLDGIYTYAKFYAMVAAGVTLCALFVAYFLTAWLQKSVSGPVMALSEMARKITRSQDYTLRIAKQSDDEVGELTTAFNDMLHTMEEREKRLALARKEAEASNALKSEFLANMSHELRTPLNSLLILAEHLIANDDGNLTNDQLADAKIIHKSGKDLLAMINGLLDLAKIEAGKMDVHAESVALDDIVSSMRGHFEPLAKSRNLRFHIDFDSTLPAHITTDRTRLEQILRNLLSNAFKFTEKGGVTFTIHRPKSNEALPAGVDTPAEGVAFVVSDTGIGIEQDKRDKIFNAFEQADEGVTRRYGGTGLGLSISREFASMLKGEISLSSVPEKGSTFTLILPEELVLDETHENEHAFDGVNSGGVPAPHERVEDDRDALTPDDYALLVVENDMNFARIVMDHAHRANLKCVVAATGEEGVRLAHSFPYAVIVLDISLPKMSGLDVYERLRDDPVLAKTPIYFMTVHNDVPKFGDDGVIGYLTKPISRDDMQRAFERIESAIVSQLESILVVDDNDTFREAVARYATKQGLAVVEAASAEEAVTCMRDHDVDCLMLDLRLPGMSGLEFLESLKRLEHPIPPVLIYSSQEIGKEDHARLEEYTQAVIGLHGSDPEALFKKVYRAINAPQRTHEKPSRLLEVSDDELAKNTPVEEAAPLDERAPVESDGSHNVGSEAKDLHAVLTDKRVAVFDANIRSLSYATRALKRQEARVHVVNDAHQLSTVVKTQGQIDLVFMNVETLGEDLAQLVRDVKSETTAVVLGLVRGQDLEHERENVCATYGMDDVIPSERLDGETLSYVLTRVMDATRKGVA